MFLDVFYVNDKYPGGCVQDQGIWTTNPMRWFRVPCVPAVKNPVLSFLPASIQDPAWTKPTIEKDSIVRLENIGNKLLTISSITSHKITGVEDWLGTDLTSASISDGSDANPNFANMTVKLNKGGSVTTGPKGYDGFVEFLSDAPSSPDTLMVHLIIADTVQFPDSAYIRTASKRITMNNAGNLGRGGHEGMALDYTWNGGDCDTFNNVTGANDNAAIYLYDASPFVLRVSGTDTIFNNYIWQANWIQYDGFRPTQGTAVDSSGAIHYPRATDPQITGLNYAKVGKFLTKDSLIGLDCEYFAPTSPDSSDFVVQKVRIYKNLATGTDTVKGVMLGEAMDWDIPSDSSVDNGSDYDASRRLMWCYGAEYGADTGQGAAWNDCILANDRAGGYAYWRGYKVSKSQPGGSSSTDTIPLKGMFTGSNPNWQADNGNFPPGALYKKLDGYTGYEPWAAQTGDPDSIYVDLNMVAFYGQFNLAPNDTLVFVKIFATTKDQVAKANTLSSIVDKARAWIQGRRGLGNCCNFPGDANNNGQLQPTDVTYIINFLYKGQSRPPCRGEGDADGNGAINALDITRIINKLYKGGAAPICPK